MTSTHSQTTSLPALTTEVINAALTNIDLLDTETRLRLMNAEDALVAAAVEREIPQIARAVQRVAASFRAGGRLLYIGAGTSGRLGVLDAVECPPTFGVSPQLVQGLIAGGPGAMFQAVEGAEDDPELGAAAIIGAEVGERDTVVGISASGQAPFVLGALRQAVKRGAATVALTNNRLTEMEKIAALTIAPIVGPEILAGSTRLKSGTAQKMVLNMISTGAMIEIGKTYGNLMVDVQTTNRKLQARAIRIVCQVTGTTPERAEAALSSAGGSAKIAIVLLQTGVTLDEAKQRLAHAGGFLRRALAEERD
jgi:N-acetylmuramic acid 6-phosphate etherase